MSSAKRISFFALTQERSMQFFSCLIFPGQEKSRSFLIAQEESFFSNTEAQSTSHDGQTEGEKESDTGASAHDSAPASQDESNGTSGSGASQGVETGPQHDSGSSPDGENGDDRNEEPQR